MRDVTPTADLTTARDRLRGRRRELVDERDALDQFCQRVERLPVSDAGTVTAPDGDRAVSIRTGDDAIAALRSAFERTVMAVPHYRDRYGDTFTERLAAELGDEVASEVRRATRLTPVLRTRVLDASDAAHERRAERIVALGDERTRLDRVEAAIHDLLDALAAIDRGNDELSRRVAHVERRGAALSADRRAVRERDDATDDLLADVYADLSADDPVLATLAAVDDLVAEYRADA